MSYSNFTASGSQPPSDIKVDVEDPLDSSPTIRGLFGIVAGLSLFFNALLCVVMLRRREMLSKTFNILIFSLAITDMLTGLFLFITPRYVVSQRSFPLLYGKSGYAFCRVIWSTYVLFCLGKASIGTVMCLAFERWYSIVKPMKYKAAFGNHRLLGYIALIWITSATTECLGLFITKLEKGKCAWANPPYGERGQRIFLVVHVLVTFYIPTTVTWVTFAHIWYHLTHSQISAFNRDDRCKRRVVRMCALAAFFLTICWFPTETFWVLKKFDVLHLPEVWYWFFNLFAMLNSCLNPLLYCLANKEYRKEFHQVFFCCIKRSQIHPEVLNDVTSTTKDTHNRENVLEMTKEARDLHKDGMENMHDAPKTAA